jgi:aryl-alcohol dehydrogenase-like predicted oxidoreductase
MSHKSRRSDPESKRITRRDWLKRVGAWGSLAALSGLVRLPWDRAEAIGSHGGQRETETIPRRPLGQTGLEVSVLCLGGYHLGTVASKPEAARLLDEALDAGVNFMDNAWEYHDGRAEEWMGAALKGKRQQVVLMTKVCSHGRDKKIAMQQLEQSLRRLQTDYLDLWQIHEVVYPDDPDRHFAPGGATEALLEAKQQGKVRHIGFTGHKDPAIHLSMLRRGFPFDTCQLPLNVFDASYRSFEHEVLPVLLEQGIAPLGMKALSGNGASVKEGIVTAEEALRYVLSLPVASVVTGIDSETVLRQNLDIARRFQPMSRGEMDHLRARVASYAATGKYELFKSTDTYDGPIGRQQHRI